MGMQTKPVNKCQQWDKLPTSTGDRRISEPSTVSQDIAEKMQHTSVNVHVGKDGIYQKHQNVVFFWGETQRKWLMMQPFVLFLKFVIWE